MPKTSRLTEPASIRVNLPERTAAAARLAELGAADGDDQPRLPHSHDVPSANGNGDIFSAHNGERRILRGAAIYSGAPRIAELAARIGFDTVWVEMEHGPTDYLLAEHLCMAAEAAGAIPTLRVSDGQRHHVLRALEVGARIVVVPMVQTADQAKQIVEYGKFPPIGSRGYNMRSRGVNYGLGDKAALFAQANARTHLFAQIETLQSV